MSISPSTRTVQKLKRARSCGTSGGSTDGTSWIYSLLGILILTSITLFAADTCDHDRLRHLWRPSRPRHRPGRDERPHRGHRRQCRGPGHGLGRLRQRRGVEVGERRYRPSSRSSTTTPSRSARSGSTPRTRRRCGSAPVRPGSATASRSATASTAPPTAATPGSTSVSKTPSASPRSRSTRPTATRSLSAPPATCGTPTRSAASTRPPTAARPGSRSSSSTTTPAAPTSTWTRRSRASSTRRCGSSVALPTSSPRAARGAGFIQSTDGGETWTELDQRSAQG